MPRKPASTTTPRRPRTKRATRTPAKGKKSPAIRKAKFALGQVVRHRVYAFRGVVFDIDPVFNNTEDWWQSIPAEIRPVKDQPYYHLLAENAETEYVAYVSEQNLLADTSGEPLRHPQLGEYFVEDEDGRYRAVFQPH
ncbi:heat shock protein HspQ [Hyphomicrobium sp. LHD-15]|uniref:heat shock protein HspQ n=1 Tax=Hyphomicrobium sp. LHD-15 TaxID=3072142 RepID=UPI0028100B49|nr:heat shock protein HspQ [Hyphomicrobium sp. LHD-15]MDQ8699671.1 heat shock protein HspQ [Hyphomicrobium sp. LHD-15]